MEEYLGLGYGGIPDPMMQTQQSRYAGAIGVGPSNNFVRPVLQDSAPAARPMHMAPSAPSSRGGQSESSMQPAIPNKNQIEAARLRALQVVQRFQQQADNNLESTSEFGRARKAFAEQFAERLRLAMLKNLEYVARMEDERLQKKLALQEETQAYQVQLEDYHNQIMQARSQHVNNNNNRNKNSQAGIGTQQRERQERKRKQQHVSNDSVALYISNLPKDGSASEELMRALFGSYGSLRKIHFYYDKNTGGLKGDALIIYNVNDVADKSELTDTVCSQMNGAELPCGTALKVEPSDPLYALRKKKQLASTYGPGAALEEQEAANLDSQTEQKHRPATDEQSSAKEEGGGEDDDLDDFFASL